MNARAAIASAVLGVGAANRAAQSVVDRHRRPLTLIGGALFLGLIVWAGAQVDLDPDNLRLTPFVINLVLLTPLAHLLNGWGLSLTARAFGGDMALRPAVETASLGVLANLVAAPVAIAARYAALDKAGLRAAAIAKGLSAGSVLRAGVTLAAASVSLAFLDARLAALTLLGSLALCVGAMATYATGGGWSAAIMMLGHRIISLMVDLARIACAFAAFGAPIPLSETPVFAAAIMAGAAAAAIPAGFGLAEFLGALAAPLFDRSAAVAVAALASNRFVGALIAGLIAARALHSFGRGSDHDR